MYSHFISYLGFCSTEEDQIHKWGNLKCRISYTVTIMPADALATLGARAPAGMALTPQSLTVPSSASEGSTHWGRVTHICVGNLTIIGSDNNRRKAITWTNTGILLIGTLGPNFSEIVIRIHTCLFKENVVCETAAILSRPHCVE